MGRTVSRGENRRDQHPRTMKRLMRPPLTRGHLAAVRLQETSLGMERILRRTIQAKECHGACPHPPPPRGPHPVQTVGTSSIRKPVCRELCFVAILTHSHKHRWEYHVPINPSSPFSQAWEFTSGKFALPLSLCSHSSLPPHHLLQKEDRKRGCFMAARDHEPTTWKEQRSSWAW